MSVKNVAVALALAMAALPAVSAPRLVERVEVSFAQDIPKDITRSIMIDDGRKIYQRYERGALRYIFIVEAVKGRGRITFWEVGSKVAYASDLRQRKDANPLDAFDSSELGREALRQYTQRKKTGEAVVNGIRCTRWVLGDGSDSTAELYEDAQGEMIYFGAFLGGKLVYQSILVERRDAVPGDLKQVAIPSGVKVNVVDESELQKRIAEIYLRAAGHDIKLLE
ncbi:MAG: hypothetical protein HPY54_15640 [Chthonomonadetes bacterium]|nr:hypothetical protein [Chthonomonadetes bacterium]